MQIHLKGSVDTQFFAHAAQLGLNGIEAEAEFAGDLGDARFLGPEAEDVELFGGKVFTFGKSA